MAKFLTYILLLISSSAICDTAPVELSNTIRINKIYGINTINETYVVDAYLVLSWMDESLTGKYEHTMTFENTLVDVAQEEGIKIPSFEFINVIGGRDIANKKVNVEPSGKVEYNERFVATFTTAMDFRKFPFDKQTFELILEPFSFDKHSLVFVESAVFPKKLLHRLLGEWEVIKEPSARESFESYSHLNGGEVSEFSRVTISIDVKRKSTYYLWQLIVPLGLIIVLSWAVFWIEGYSERLSTSFTLLLTVVAYSFYTSNFLPNLPYTTIIERIVIFSYISIFATTVLVVKKSDKSIHFLRKCRVIFPIFFLLSMSTLVVIGDFGP